MTVFSDSISARWGTEYFFKLAKSIAFTIGKEVYVRVRKHIYKVTADIVTLVENIPLPIAVTSSQQPSNNGWAGATRLSLVHMVSKHKNNTIYEYLKEKAEDTQPSEIRTVARKLLDNAGIHYQVKKWESKFRDDLNFYLKKESLFLKKFNYS